MSSWCASQRSATKTGAADTARLVAGFTGVRQFPELALAALAAFAGPGRGGLAPPGGDFLSRESGGAVAARRWSGRLVPRLRAQFPAPRPRRRARRGDLV